MRDLMVLAGILVLVPLAISDLFVAYLIWGWTAVISLESYVYGFAQSLRLNLLFALITLGVFLLSKDPSRKKYKWNRTALLICLFVVQASISTLFAFPDNPFNFAIYDKLIKISIFVLLMPLIVTQRYRIHVMVIAISAGLAFHGLLDGLKFFVSGGHHLVRGLSKFGDNNHFASVMVMIIPLLLYISQNSSKFIVRYGAKFLSLAVTGAVIGTHSRGGFVGLMVIGLSLIIASQKKFGTLMLVAIAAVVMISLAPASWTDRMHTIDNAESDSSFMTRVEAWQVSSAVALANPLLGGGFHSIQVHSVWSQYRYRTGLLGWIDNLPETTTYRAAHSVYFEVLGDLGFSGLLLFMLILFNALYTGRQVSKMARMNGHKFRWAVDLSRALSLSVIAFMVTGLTVSIAYYEIIYIIVMLIEVLKQTVMVEINSTKSKNI